MRAPGQPERRIANERMKPTKSSHSVRSRREEQWGSRLEKEERREGGGERSEG